MADLARQLHPDLADRIHTGSVMTWQPPRRYDYVTVLEDAVPADGLSVLIERCLTVLVAGHEPDGIIHIDRPGRSPLQTVWLDARTAQL